MSHRFILLTGEAVPGEFEGLCTADARRHIALQLNFWPERIELIGQSSILKDSDPLLLNLLVLVLSGPVGAPVNTQGNEVIERKVRSCLLKQTFPHNLKTVVEEFALIQPDSAQELEFLSSVIFRRALQDPNQCWAYAAIIAALNGSTVADPAGNPAGNPTGHPIYPEFPRGNGPPMTLLRSTLNLCQEYLEDNILGDFISTEIKRAMVANMKFIGHLLLHQLVAMKVVGRITFDLIGVRDTRPEEHMIESVCELLRIVGAQMDENAWGGALMSLIMARLSHLKRTRDVHGGTPFYSTRIISLIEDLVDKRETSEFLEQRLGWRNHSRPTLPIKRSNTAASSSSTGSPIKKSKHKFSF